jgi:hypothetical protein
MLQLPEYTALVKKLIDAAADKDAKLARFMQRWNFRSVDGLAQNIWLFSGGGARKPGAGSQFDNTNTIYYGFGDFDPALNRGIERVRRPAGTAPPAAAAAAFQMGDLKRPLLAVNSLYDAIIRVETAAYFGELVERMGNAEHFVQLWVDSASPLYNARQVGHLLGQLHAWVKDGRRPQAGEMTVR